MSAFAVMAWRILMRQSRAAHKRSIELVTVAVARWEVHLLPLSATEDKLASQRP